MKWLILQLASSSLLRLGEDQADKDAIRNRESIYLLLDLVIIVTIHLRFRIDCHMIHGIKFLFLSDR